MKVSKTELSETKVKLVISAETADLAPIKNKVLKHLAKHTKVAGFREGKAPLSVVEKHADQNRLQTEFLDESINHLYVETIKEQDLRPIDHPQIELKKFVPYNEIEFSAEVEVVGKITLPDYTKIKVPLMPKAVGENEINEVLNRLSIQSAKKTEVKRPAKETDEAWIDFSGKDKDGKPVSGADGKDYPLVLGSNTFIPGFEENLVGLKTGDEKSFDVTFPKDYGVSTLQSKKVTFTVKINKINQVDKPKIDQNFAESIGPFKSVDELKDDIRKNILAERSNQARREQENTIVQKIAEKTTVTIPDVMIEEQITAFEDEEKRNLAYRGQTWQEHLDEEGITEQEHRERKRESAINRVKGGLILSEVAKKEGISVTPEELEIRIQILKGQYQDPAMQAELNKLENRRDIEAQILTEKTLSKLVEYSS